MLLATLQLHGSITYECYTAGAIVLLTMPQLYCGITYTDVTAGTIWYYCNVMTVLQYRLRMLQLVLLTVLLLAK